MPLNPGTYFLACNVFQTDRHRIRMPGISKSTSVPCKVLNLWYYTPISVRIGNERNCENGFVQNLSYKVFKRKARILNSEWLLITR